MKIYDYNGKKNICGDRLREARVVRRLRQEDLAAQIQLKGINMERDSISRIEIGTRFVSDFELKIFAEVLEEFKKACADNGTTPTTEIKKFIAAYCEAARGK
jgi:transcriptional regulator with XRE-family HTH domain